MFEIVKLVYYNASYKSVAQSFFVRMFHSYLGNELTNFDKTSRFWDGIYIGTVQYVRIWWKLEKRGNEGKGVFY